MLCHQTLFPFRPLKRVNVEVVEEIVPPKRFRFLTRPTSTLNVTIVIKIKEILRSGKLSFRTQAGPVLGLLPVSTAVTVAPHTQAVLITTSAAFKMCTRYSTRFLEVKMLSKIKAFQHSVTVPGSSVSGTIYTKPLVSSLLASVAELNYKQLYWPVFAQTELKVSGIKVIKCCQTFKGNKKVSRLSLQFKLISLLKYFSIKNIIAINSLYFCLLYWCQSGLLTWFILSLTN